MDLQKRSSSESLMRDAGYRYSIIPFSSLLSFGLGPITNLLRKSRIFQFFFGKITERGRIEVGDSCAKEIVLIGHLEALV